MRVRVCFCAHSAVVPVSVCQLMSHVSLFVFQKQITDLKSENEALNEKLKSEEQKRLSREKANSVSCVILHHYRVLPLLSHESGLVGVAVFALTGNQIFLKGSCSAAEKWQSLGPSSAPELCCLNCMELLLCLVVCF